MILVQTPVNMLTDEGIETGYRMVKAMRITTRSKNEHARFLCFAASLLLYNA